MATSIPPNNLYKVTEDDDEDPINMLPFPSVAKPVDETGSSVIKGRTLRPRKSLVATNAAKKAKQEVVERVVKRPRTASLFGGENHAQPAKKVKVEKDKSVGVMISAKKAGIEARRRRFFTRHRTVFEPLLPFNSNFFEKFTTECITAQSVVYRPRREVEDQPRLIQGGQMKDYQLQGLSFLIWMHENGMNSILGDEMGLGKTLQTLSLFAYIKDVDEVVPEPHLIVCPLSVLSSWMNESARWLPSFKVLRFHGPQVERMRLKEQVKVYKFDVVITTYETYVAEDSWFKAHRWTYCVLDEGHRIKAWTTNLSHKVQGLGSQYRLILTGTPLQNNLLELWSLLHWLYPSLFTPPTERRFQEAFDLSLGKFDPAFLDVVQRLLQLIMLRRTKKTVEFTVPPLEELVVFLPLTEAQRFWYMRLLKRLDTISLDEVFTCKIEGENDGRMEAQALVARAMSQSAGQKIKNYQQLMNLLMQLRRVCDHPYILTGSLPEPYAIGEHIVASSSKLQFIDKLLGELLPKGERVLCFSQWTGMLDMLEDYMALRDIPYCRLDGSVPRPRRALDIRLFQQEKSPYQVFLISTHAGGLGINLTKAAHVIMCDSTWNPQTDLQAIARSHRIGQTKAVKVYRLICQNSVEDQMLDRLRRKLYLSVKVMSSDSQQSAKMDPALKMHELMQILRKGTSALARWEADSADKGLSAFLSAPIEEILARSKQQENLRDFKIKHEVGEAMEDEKLTIDLAEEERKLLSGIAQVQTRLFEGRHHEKDNRALAKEWSAMEDRARVNRLITINGIEHLPDNLVSVSSKMPKPPKRKKATWEHEDYCVECRDGGSLLCCQNCPRVFHAACVGLPNNADKLPMVLCPQHACAECGRKTADAGGMLFRCRCCAAAHCEDCLPEGDIAAIGPTIPELVLLGFGEIVQAYWVHCKDCIERFETDEQWRRSWEMEDENLKARLQMIKVESV